MLTVSLHVLPADVKALIGTELGGHYILADVKVEPKYGKEVVIDRDDFMLRTDKDGERTKPFVPSQIAGEGVLVVSRGAAKGGGIGIGGGYPDYPPGYPGGYPPMGAPPIMTPGVGVGVGGGEDENKATAKTGNPEKPNPLKQALEERMLPNQKTEKPVSGLLYFPMEKQKMKDLELVFGGVENRIRLRFKTQ
jgi:hypothetical protein